MQRREHQDQPSVVSSGKLQRGLLHCRDRHTGPGGGHPPGAKLYQGVSRTAHQIHTQGTGVQCYSTRACQGVEYRWRK